MHELLVIVSVILNAYLISALCLSPLMVVCWLYAIPLTWSNVLRTTGWGANTVIVFVLMLRLI